MKKIKVWTRLRRERYDEWKLVETDNPGGIPEAVMKTFNRVFWKMRNRGVLFPLDEFAAYQAGVLAIVEANDALVRGVKTLTTCSPHTYLIATGVMRLRQFARQEVRIVREQYRKLEDRCVAGECDLQAIVEALSDMGHAAVVQSRTLALHCVEETLKCCTKETQCALRTLLCNDMSVRRAAHELKMSHQIFIWRRDKVWFPEFRRHCSWAW